MSQDFETITPLHYVIRKELLRVLHDTFDESMEEHVREQHRRALEKRDFRTPFEPVEPEIHLAWDDPLPTAYPNQSINWFCLACRDRAKEIPSPTFLRPGRDRMELEPCTFAVVFPTPVNIPPEPVAPLCRFNCYVGQCWRCKNVYCYVDSEIKSYQPEGEHHA